jgi:hypothetical protein
VLQVYELLDVLECSGPDAVAAHTVPHLSWEEVQALTGPGTVGLPLGYKPDAQQQLLGRALVQKALPAASAEVVGGATGNTQKQLQMTAVGEAGVLAIDGPGQQQPQQQQQRSMEGAPQGNGAGAVMVVVEAVNGTSHGADLTSAGDAGWRQHGWQRSQYLVGRGADGVDAMA